MASGTISGGNYNNIYSYYMTWTSTSNGSSANTSNVTLNWIYKKNASDPYGAYNTSGSSKVTLTIGSNSSGAVRADFDLRSASTGTTKTIATYTVNNIAHNADGTLSLNVSGSHVTGTSWGTKSISSTQITLDTIPRYATCSQTLSSRTETSLTVNWTSDSVIDKVWYSTNNGSSWTEVSGTPNAKTGSYTISSLSVGTTYQVKTRVRRKDSQLNTDSSKTDMTTYSYPYVKSLGSSALTIGNQQTIYLYNPLGRSVTVYMKTGSSGTSGTQLYSGTTTNKTDVGFSFTPTASTMYNQIPNAKSGNCVYYVVYSSNTSAVKAGTYVVNESTNKPTVTSETPYDTNDTTYGLTNDRSMIVLNASNLQLTIVANAKNGATFQNNGYIKVNGTSLTLTHNGSNATGVYTINKPSSRTFTITLQDSRGIPSGNISYSIPNYKNYFVPTLSATAVRNQPTDGIININGNGTFFNASFGNATNTLTATYSVKEASTSTVLESGSLTITTSGNNHTETQKQVSNADYTKQYTVSVAITDELNTITSNITVSKGVPIFNWDNNEFDVNVPFYAKNNIYIDSGYNLRGIHAGSWYQGRKRALAYNYFTGTSTSYFPIISSKTKDGDWSIGTYGGDNVLRAVYTTDSNYDSSTNTTARIAFPTVSEGNTVTLATTSDIPSVANMAKTNVNNYFSTGQSITGDFYVNGRPTTNSTHGWGVTSNWSITSAITTDFQTTIFGSKNSNSRMKAIRNGGSALTGFAGTYSPSIAITTGDTHMMLSANYGTTPILRVSGGNVNTQLAWTRDVTFNYTDTGTGTATKSSGNANITAVQWAQSGKVVTLSITFNTSGGTTAVGGDAWKGTISGVLLPKLYSGGVGYYSSTMYVGELDSSGNLTIRVIGAQSASNSNTHRIYFTYVGN